MATVTVRQATPDDAAELARMLDLFDRLGATPEQVAARILACQAVLTTLLGGLDGPDGKREPRFDYDHYRILSRHLARKGVRTIRLEGRCTVN